MTPRVLFICTGNYYRSRFAEALFNHHAEARAMSWRAFSRGLAIHVVPDGVLSSQAVRGLNERGIPLHHTGPTRVQISEEDLQEAQLAIALKEDEHRPLLDRLFPTWSDRVTFWDIDDMPKLSSRYALPRIEQLVLDLLEKLEKS